MLGLRLGRRPTANKRISASVRDLQRTRESWPSISGFSSIYRNSFPYLILLDKELLRVGCTWVGQVPCGDQAILLDIPEIVLDNDGAGMFTHRT